MSFYEDVSSFDSDNIYQLEHFASIHSLSMYCSFHFTGNLFSCIVQASSVFFLSSFRTLPFPILFTLKYPTYLVSPQLQNHISGVSVVLLSSFLSVVSATLRTKQFASLFFIAYILSLFLLPNISLFPLFKMDVKTILFPTKYSSYYNNF